MPYEIVNVDNLHDFLQSEGLEVVHGAYLQHSRIPVLFVRPKSDPRDPRCACGHDRLLHDLGGGPCLAVTCECSGYVEAL